MVVLSCKCTILALSNVHTSPDETGATGTCAVPSDRYCLIKFPLAIYICEPVCDNITLEAASISVDDTNEAVDKLYAVVIEYSCNFALPNT